MRETCLHWLEDRGELIGLALVVLALMSLIENWFKQRTKAVVFIAFLAIIGVVK